jgi:positive regulator of sigma E activity
MTTIYFYSLRIEKFLAIKSFFTKYLNDIYRFSLIAIIMSYILSKKAGSTQDIKVLILILTSIFISIIYKLMFERVVNTKNNNINKYLERLIIIAMNILLMVSVYL